MFYVIQMQIFVHRNQFNARGSFRVHLDHWARGSDVISVKSDETF